MSQAKKGAGDEMFTRGAWDTLVDAEKSFGVYITVEVKATRRMGVLEVVMFARKPLSHVSEHSVVRVVGEFPNATAQTLAAFVYAQSVKIYHCLEAWYTDQEKGHSDRVIAAGRTA